MKTVFSVFALITVLFLGCGADEASATQLSIRSIQARGTGCPHGTVEGFLSDDGSLFGLSFPAFTAEAGFGLPLSMSRKNCQLLIDLEVPRGFSFSLMDIQYQGYVEMPFGSEGFLRTNYFFTGDSESVGFSATLRGPLFGDFVAEETTGIATTGGWSSCEAERALNINTSIGITRVRGGFAMISVDSMTGSLNQLFRLKWRRCE
jgi:hypothetical protein